MKIMIVDNDLTYLGLLSEVLVLHGYEVVTALDGEEALTKLKESLVDFIISDISMPRMNGMNLHRFLRQDPRLKHIPFAWNSMYRELQDVVELEDSAIDLKFAKTMTVHDLLHALNDFGSQHQLAGA